MTHERPAADALRRQAEERLRAAAPTLPTDAELARLVHELQVHQVELQLQNDELAAIRSALERSLVDYTDLFDFAPVGYLTLDAEGGIHAMNLAAASLLGGERGTLIGGRLGLHVHLQDRVALATAIDDLYLRRRTVSCDLRMERPDGAPAIVRFDGAPGAGDAFARVILQDVTDLRLADLEIRMQNAAFDAVGTPVLISERSGIIRWVNAAFTTLTGYTRAETIGRHPRELLRSGVQEPAFYKQMWETISAGLPWKGELVNRRKDGTLYPEAMSITPLRDPSGAVAQFIAVKRDLTDDRAREADALQSQKLESIGLLAGGIAHDFNNLLTVIMGATDLALTETDTPTALQADLEEINQAAERAAELTRQLLAFSRRQILQPTILDLNAVLSDVQRLLARLIDANIVITLHLADDLSTVRTDAGQLGQVVMNLAINARDAMPNGGRLDLTTSNRDLLEPARSVQGAVPPGMYVALEVRDNGSGMTPETMAHAFEPFFTTKVVGQGTGLGLSTVLGIVGQGNGYVQVESVLGAGTVITILLPRSIEPLPTPAPTPAPHPPGHETILVVDDEPALRRVSERSLTLLGYEVLTSGSGAEALALLDARGGAVDLMITDVVMPEMSGPELVVEVGRRYPAIRVLYTSGYTADALLRAGVDADQIRFLAKPFSIAQLAETVRTLLDGSHDGDAGASPVR